MSEDIIVEIGDVSAIVVEVQSIGGKGDAGDGLKEYASLAELEAVAVAEIGVIRGVPAETFTPTPIIPGALFLDAIIQTQITRVPSVSPLPIRIQYATLVNLASITTPAVYFRVDVIAGAFGAWTELPSMPSVPVTNADVVMFRVANSVAWNAKGAATIAGPSTVVVRDYLGRAQIVSPVDPADIANKDYVDKHGVIEYTAAGTDMERNRLAEVGLNRNAATVGNPGNRLSLNSPVMNNTWYVAGTQQFEQVITLGNGTFSRVWQAGTWSSWVAQPARTSAPASWDAPGMPGMTAMDANYFYVCVATNSWRRTPLVIW